MSGHPRVLVATTPIPAHTFNALPLVRGLVDVGMTVRWHAAPEFADVVSAAGATFIAATPTTSAAYRLRAHHRAVRGLASIRSFYRDVIASSAVQQASELSSLITSRTIDVTLSDTLMLGMGLAAASAGVPWVTFGDGPLWWRDVDTPPFGSGLPPMAGRPGRHRNRHVQRAIDRTIFQPALDLLNAERRRRGLAPAETMPRACMSDRLHLQGCSPSFEYPRAGLPGHVRFVGALGPGTGIGTPVPSPLRRAARKRPLAVVTQGTLRRDPNELIAPASRALTMEGYHVLVAGHERVPGARSSSAHVTTVRTLDYADALDHCDLLVTNGGYTGVTMALQAGVPMVVCGATEEKPDIGARVAWAGVGAYARVTRPPVWLVRRLVREVMGSDDRRRASAAMAAEMRGYDARTLGAGLVSDLASGVDFDA